MSPWTRPRCQTRHSMRVRWFAIVATAISSMAPASCHPGATRVEPNPRVWLSHDVSLSPDPIVFHKTGGREPPLDDGSTPLSPGPVTKVDVTITNPGLVAVTIFYLALEPDVDLNHPHEDQIGDVLRFMPTANECLSYLSGPADVTTLITFRTLQPGEQCHVLLECVLFSNRLAFGWLVAYGVNGTEIGRAAIDVFP